MHLCLYGSIAWRHPGGFPQVIDWATEYGWEMVDARGLTLEIPGDETKKLGAFGYDMLGPRQIRPSARDELKLRLADAGLPLLGIYCSSPVNLRGELGERCRDLFREFVQLAADLGAGWVRAINNTTASYEGEDFTPEQAFEQTVDGLRKIAPFAADLDVGLMLENNENTTTSDAESLVRMQDAVGNACRTGIAYDPVNAYFQGHDPTPGFETLKGRITCLHLKNVRRSDASQHQYLPRGEYSYQWSSLSDGDLDWPALLALARQSGFDGPLVFEYVNPFKGMPAEYWNTLREPHHAAAEEADFLRQALISLA
jgi:sugar phosphate isomerase/epimerase